MIYAEFFVDAIEAAAQSEAAGRPVYVDVECIKILVGGSRDEIVRIATPEDKKTYADQYSRFRSKAAQQETGTPLAEMPAIGAAMRKTLDGWNVRTVEALAALSDIGCQQVGGNTMALREQAKAYLAKAAGSAVTNKLTVENERMRSQIEELQRQIALLGNAQIAQQSEDDDPLTNLGVDGDDPPAAKPKKAKA